MGRLRSLEKMTPKKAIFSTVLSKIVATLVPELVLDFSLREKPGDTERALTSELRNSFLPLFSFPTSY